MSKVTLPLTIDTKELAESLVNTVNQGTLFKLITEIDAQEQDLGFTKRLQKYFNALVVAEEREG